MQSPQPHQAQPPLTQPPDPHPRKPLTPCPAGAIDCHIHMFGPASRYAFHPQSRYSSLDALPQHYRALQQAIGIAGAVIVSGGGYGIDHSHLAGILEAHPGQFKGVALISEDISDADLDRLTRLGVCGARFVSPGHRGALPRLSSRLAERVHDWGWHVQFYPAAGDLEHFGPLLEKLPNTRIVLDHFAALPASGGTAQSGFGYLLRLLDSGRFYVKLSGPMRCTLSEPPYADMLPLAQALVRAAPERLLWGTDWPHVNMNGRTMPNDGELFDLLGQWAPEAQTRQRILVDNPRAVYGEFGAGMGRA
ncbi:MAG: amidohydrolase family protein [Hylemonella sp.]